MKLNFPVRVMALTTCVLLLPLNAVAGMPTESVMSQTVTVKYSPSNAATGSGAERLYGSLRLAAESACRDSSMKGIVLDTGYQSCATSALDEAVEKVNIPALRDLHMQNRKR